MCCGTATIPSPPFSLLTTNQKKNLFLAIFFLLGGSGSANPLPLPPGKLLRANRARGCVHQAQSTTIQQGCHPRQTWKPVNFHPPRFCTHSLPNSSKIYCENHLRNCATSCKKPSQFPELSKRSEAGTIKKPATVKIKDTHPRRSV